MKIAIAGAGYVGLSLATLLAQHNEVKLVDVVQDKVDKINNKISPIKDEYIEKYLKEKELNLVATLEGESAYKNAEIVVIATPTNYDIEKNFFNTKHVEEVIEPVLKVNPTALIVIKSTIPLGYTEAVKKKYNITNILFVPEFLRESKALYDNLYPSRIIIGCDLNDEYIGNQAKIFANLLQEGAIKENIPTLFMYPTEAEAVKLFANTYLAMRVGYFNELDTYAELKNLNVKSIIDGMCLDPRIGIGYNNPSFGYGGYCLPKDTKQLKANYANIPEDLISAIVESNNTRKEFIADQIVRKAANKIIGIYRLNMKSDSDNLRASALIDIVKILNNHGISVIIYEPIIEEKEFLGNKVLNNIEAFKDICDFIITNRYDVVLDSVKEKVYTRDIYREN